jgi:nicotinamidase-related amidase
MPIPRLRTEDTCLLVVDVQEKLVPTVAGSDRLVHNAALMLRLATELNMPYLVTEHYPKGLGRTVEAIDAAMLDRAARVEKTRFSAVVDLVDDMLTAWRRTSVLVCGIEAHVCVLQTALDLQASGRQAFVVSDAVASSQPEQFEHACRRWEAAGAVTTGVMSATYELLGDAKHSSRRACVDLARRIMP